MIKFIKIYNLIVGKSVSNSILSLEEVEELTVKALLSSGTLLETAKSLSLPEQWSLIEKLDPSISHFEFFLSNKSRFSL